MLLTVPLDTLNVHYGRASMHVPSLMHTKIRFPSSVTCMLFATANPLGLITTSLILHQPTLMAIACHLHIIILGHPLCSRYVTILMLLHVIAKRLESQRATMRTMISIVALY
jgi:hypothetical protein